MHKMSKERRQELQNLLRRAADLTAEGEVISLVDAATITHFIMRIATDDCPSEQRSSAETDFIVFQQDADETDRLYLELSETAVAT